MNTNDQITVFGANGRIGQLVVAALQAQNIRVIAAVHSHHSFTESDSLRVVKMDIYDSESVARALQGSSIVISTLGSWGTKHKDVLTVGMTNIIVAMQQQSISRIISLTGAESRAPGDTLGLVHRAMHLTLGITAGKILRDGEAHITLLTGSQLDWTVIRSPIMSDSKRAGHGQLTLKRPYPWQLVGRHLVVDAIVSCAVDELWVKQAPFIV